MNTVNSFKILRFYASLTFLPAISFPNNDSLNYFLTFPPLAPVVYRTAAGDNTRLRVGTGTCKRGNELSGSITRGEFLDKLRNG
jgi:hypothetical protein